MKQIIVSVCSALLLFAIAIVSAAQKHSATAGNALGPSQAALDTITADGVMSHIKVLSSDEFEGRGPGTHGEELSINYIADEFKKAGLAPGNTDGTYFQKVPLVGITTKQDAEMRIKAANKDLKLKFGEDFVARSVRVVDKTGFDADMVFVGYGVVAPEYGWDDYKGMDVRG